MSSTLKYKDFSGSVQFSAEDEVFHGKLIGIDDLVTFEGESVTQLKESFEEAVDDYLELCESVGKSPFKSYKGSFNVRISPALHKQLAHKSLEMGVSLNQLVEQAINEKLEGTTRQ